MDFRLQGNRARIIGVASDTDAHGGQVWPRLDDVAWDDGFTRSGWS